MDKDQTKVIMMGKNPEENVEVGLGRYSCGVCGSGVWVNSILGRKECSGTDCDKAGLFGHAKRKC